MIILKKNLGCRGSCENSKMILRLLRRHIYVVHREFYYIHGSLRYPRKAPPPIKKALLRDY